MKLAKLLQSFVIICAFSNLLSAQTAPNLENGWKPYGSYDGTRLDTVNVMNGNLMVHAPLIPDAPQRGSLKVSNTLYASSKDWQAICTNTPNGGQSCGWQKGGAGVIILPAPGLSVHRTRDNTFIAGTNDPTSIAYGYTVVTPDQSTHQLHNGDATDLSGYHIALSVPDSYGVPLHVSVTDRSGNQYDGDFKSGKCQKAPTTFMISSPGPVQPIVDDVTTGDQYCPETAFASLVTDSNGNQVNLHGPDNPNPSVDTLGKLPALTSADVAPDFSDCVSEYPFYIAMTYHYQDPNGVVRNVKLCAADVPIHTAYGQTSGPPIAEAISSTDPNDTSGLHFRPIVTAVLDDKTKWTFDYDNYGEIISVGLPTGGSITYTWQTINYLGCNDGSPSHFSRAVHTRTLNDGQGHSYQWTYNWGTIAGGSLTNVVTGPLGNDTAHVFSDLSLQIGTVPYCKFYETSTIQYQGAQSANNPLQRVDTQYSTANIEVSTDDFSPRNVFATDVLTTVYPSGKVKKVHKDPDTGLGPGLPIFGNVKKELEYDWGQGVPGPLLRETDTTYQWETHSDYLSAHLLDLPASVVIKDGSGCALSETDYLYDEAAYLTATNVTVQHVLPPNTVRGNQTTVTRWLAPTSSCNPTGGTAVASHTNWYDTGEPYQKIDPLGHITTLSYDSAYAAAYVTQTCSPQTGSVVHCVSGTYDFNTGVLTSLTNENATTQASGNTPGDSAHTSNYAYDSMFRITSAQAPPDPANGGSNAQTSFSFSTPNVFPLSVQRTKSITTALSDSATSFFDGLGRGYKSQHVLPAGTAIVDTLFDPSGPPGTVSNPYFSTADPTYGSTTNLYDALGRVYQTTKQDGSISSVAYSVQTTIAVNGDCVQTTDEAGKLRRACSDALGRLTEVDEPNPGAQATWAQASVIISGSEQANPLPGAAGAGYVDIGGNEGSTTSCSDPEPPARPVCSTAYDVGSVSIQVGSYPAKSASFGRTSTQATIASALAAAFHNDGSSPVDAAVSPSNTSRILFTARGTGVATNYALSVSPTSTTGMDFFGTASGATLTGGRDASSSPDTGSLTITIGSAVYQTTYGGSDTASTIATRLASAISGGPWANASASGGTVTITAKSTGPGGDYTLSASSSYDTAHFGQPSFTPAPSASALSGGYDPGAIDNQPFRTLYAYDALGNLLRVDQKGTAPNDSTQWRTRTFTYDSLSRLLTANNPESGTITYSYDADGNLLQKTSPAPNQTGTATQIVSYCYDELHRVTGKGYGAQSCPLATPVVSYAYDSGTNAIGKLTSLTDQAGTASYTYDILGRLAAETRTIAGISKSTSYSYNLDGSMKTLTYPSGRVVTYTPDSAGRLLSAVDGNGTNYVTSASYNPDSSLKSLLNGSTPALNQNFQYTPRLQLCRITALTSGTLPTSCYDSQHIGNIMDRGYDFHAGNGTAGSGTDNGNVFAITNYRDTTRSQAFTYDALNRLASGWSSANTGAYSWGENYSIDAWGNLQISPMSGKAHGGNFTLSGNAQNRPTGMNYDAAGNLLSYLTANYSYDQENRLLSTAGMTYTYDDNGERVLKSQVINNVLTPVKRYWSMGGNTLAEGDGSGNLTAEYIYFGGKRVARIDLPANTVHYYLSDHLGSTSIVASAAGAVEEESDYYPFGTEVIVTGPGVNELKFTGKRRDAESQLDYFGARHYSNVSGRFGSPDEPLLDQDELNPQSWNLYSYVRNNPLNAIDPDGRAVLVCFSIGNGNGSSCGWVSDDDYKKARAADSQIGISAPGGNHPYGDITCGGQVCGSVIWSSGSPSDHNQPDNGAIIPGTLGPADPIVFGGLRSLMSDTATEAVIGGAVTGGAGRGLLTATEGVLLSNGTKAAAKDIVEGMAEGAQKASLKRGLRAAGSQAKVTLQKTTDGAVRLMINRIGKEGGQTIIKTVAVDGSSKTVQVAVDGAGKLVHYDPKN